MPINHEEIIEDLEGQIRKFAGAWSEWCVGTAKDSRGPFFRRHLAADLGDGLAYREAYTTNAAQAAVAHLVNNRGLELVPEAERCSALRGAVPEPGKIVFVYHRARDTGYGARDTGVGLGDSGKVGIAPAAPGSDHATFLRRAA
jgi:hypothetical protein